MSQADTQRLQDVQYNELDEFRHQLEQGKIQKTHTRFSHDPTSVFLRSLSVTMITMGLAFGGSGDGFFCFVLLFCLRQGFFV